MSIFRFKTLSGTMILALALMGNALGAQGDTTVAPPPSIQPYVPPIEPVVDPMPGKDATAGTEIQPSEAISLIGHPVQNLQGARLGEVDTLLVTTNGQVSAIVVGTGGLLGMGKDRYEIPWSQVQWQNHGSYLVVDVAEGQMRAEFSAFEFK